MDLFNKANAVNDGVYIVQHSLLWIHECTNIKILNVIVLGGGLGRINWTKNFGLNLFIVKYIFHDNVCLFKYIFKYIFVHKIYTNEYLNIFEMQIYGK